MFIISFEIWIKWNFIINQPQFAYFSFEPLLLPLCTKSWLLSWEDWLFFLLGTISIDYDMTKSNTGCVYFKLKDAKSVLQYNIKLSLLKETVIFSKTRLKCVSAPHGLKTVFTSYHTRSIITCSWFETALDYKLQILGLFFLV